MTKRRTGEVLSSIDLPLWMPISFMTVMGALAVVVTMALAALTLRRAFDRAVHDR
jgi:hypothetical protein